MKSSDQKKKKKNKFTGKYSKLSEPIVIPNPPSLPTLLTSGKNEKNKQSAEKWEKACTLIGTTLAIKKLGLLFDWYGIDKKNEDRWFNLAFRLAIDYIPGFSTAKPPGRHNEWDDFRLLKLNWEVKKVQKEKGQYSAQDACRLLAKRPNEYSQTQRTLYNRFIESNKSDFQKFLDNISENTNLSPSKIDTLVKELFASKEKQSS